MIRYLHAYLILKRIFNGILNKFCYFQKKFLRMSCNSYYMLGNSILFPIKMCAMVELLTTRSVFSV